MKILAAIALLVALWPTPAHGHALEPALLNIEESPQGDINAVLRHQKIAATSSISVSISPPCRALAPASHQNQGPLQIQQWRWKCGPAGLEGRQIHVQTDKTEIITEIHRASGHTQRASLTPAEPVLDLAAPKDTALPFYLQRGVWHVLTGADHILFTLGLAWIIGLAWRALALLITAFTLGHSLSLVAVALGWVSVPSAPAEALIAASVLLLAHTLAQGDDMERPWGFAAACGLIHGAGFGAAVLGLGLPEDAALPALALFNAGVEIGQLAVLAVSLLALTALSRAKDSTQTRVKRAVAYAMGTLAAFWFFERLTLMLG